MPRIIRNDLTPRYRWNPALGNYIDPRGRMVPRAAVSAELERVIADSQARIGSISAQLKAGQVTLADWQRAMAEEIKVIQTASAASAAGGWAQMTPADWGAVGQRCRIQYEYLRRFAAQIYSGAQPLNGRFLARARMYAAAGRGTFEWQEYREAVRRGKREERLFLDPFADHCDDCLADSDRGWVAIGSLAPVGERQCITNCRCHKEYR